MRPRTTIVLALLALLAGGTILLWERGLPGTDERRERGRRLLPGIELDDIGGVTVERAGLRVAIERRDRGWWLVSPLDDRADPFRAESLIRDALGLRVEAWVPAAEVLGGDDATGLGGDATRITLLVEGEPRELELGTEEAPGASRFVRVAGDERLAVVRAPAPGTFDRPASSYRDPSLIDARAPDVSRLAVERGGETWLAAERRGDPGDRGAWWITHPFEDEADGARISSLLGGLLALRVDSFADDDDGGEPERTADWRFVVGLDDGAGADAERDESGEEASGDDASPGAAEDGARVESAPVRVELALAGAGDGESGPVAARVSGRSGWFSIDAYPLLRELESPPESFRSLVALDIPTFEIERVEMRGGSDVVEIDRVEGEYEIDERWRVVTPADFELDAEAFDRAVAELGRVDALRVAFDEDSAAMGLDDPVASVTFHFAGARPAITLDIGSDAGDGSRYVRRSGRDAALVVSSDVAARVDPLAYAESASAP